MAELLPLPRQSMTEEEFYSDLSNFIPIGSLTVKSSSPGKLGDTWVERVETLLPSPLFPLSSKSKRWIRTFTKIHPQDPHYLLYRIYIVPADVGRRYLQRTSSEWSHLRKLIERLNASREAWEGVKPIDELDKDSFFSNDPSQSATRDSLFYLFNTLPSPVPSLSTISCPFAKKAIFSVLDHGHELLGLKAELYTYQRRTAASMILRETEPALALDPRLETLRATDGRPFYYDHNTGLLLRQPRLYEEARGGILAETMGFGKTLICLATILATRGHWPQIPPEYSVEQHPTRPRVGSLMEMAAASTNRKLIPWKAFLLDHASQGFEYTKCEAMLAASVPSYVIPAPGAWRSRRLGTMRSGKLIRLCSTTLVIVPSNLFNHWKNEISLHLKGDALQVLYIDNNEIRLPAADSLSKYDLILMSKMRIKQEMSLTSSLQNLCQCTGGEGCQCSPSATYHSPLEDLHLLRIIVDEGHDFSSFGRTNSAIFALQKLHVERRWIVSGTPSPGLLGVEVSTSVQETFGTARSHDPIAIRRILESRRTDFVDHQEEASVKKSALLQERKDLEKLGSIVADFLNLKPWANVKGGEDQASWKQCIMPDTDGKRKPKSLRSLLESLVVRHRIEDIEREIGLPPLHNHTVYLKPRWQDKLSINLFMLTLTANAVTSERVDQDYMFHPKNRAALNQLIANLRQSAFYWTSFQPEEIRKTIEISRSYMEKLGHWEPASNRFVPHHDSQKEDFVLLQEAMQTSEKALGSPSWSAFARIHELGLYVDDFPENAMHEWSLVDHQSDEPLLLGATQLTKAQNYVDTHLYELDPASGLGAAGVDVAAMLWKDVKTSSEHSANVETHANGSPNGANKGLESTKSTSTQKPQSKGTHTISRAKPSPSPRKSMSLSGNITPYHMRQEDEQHIRQPMQNLTLKSALKRSPTKQQVEVFSPGSPLIRTRLCGTASAKLSYLIDRLSSLHQKEKIIVFYEGDNIAYYIAQALELLDIRFLIYTGSLSMARKSTYLATFNATESFRVLLMDVHQAAHGLHIASASRVFFVNPVWQPTVEAQAIKRAHRIGQKKPVYVETLVLKDTIEDQMLQRRKQMSAQEHQKAEKSLVDDSVMEQLLKNARFIPLEPEEMENVRHQMAELRVPQQIFGRQDRAGIHHDPDADLIFPEGVQTPKSKKRKIVAAGKSSPRNGESPSSERAARVGFQL
ncbi:MAG: hypothetical protein Q9190_003528 [Brigantiaea leucoxantha]